MSNSATYTVTDSTGSVATIPAKALRDEVILRCSGATVYWALNEEAEYGTGSYMETGDALVLTGKKANAAFHAVCDSGQTSTLNAQLD